MAAVVVVGAQWGDEGKGKIVDIYAQHADVVVRYAGGANAGHTLVVNGEQLIFHLIPSGALHATARCVLAQGTVVDPQVLLREIAALDARGHYDASRFLVSERAHLVLPQHVIVDGLRDGKAGSLGTTKRGIGPCYEDKVARRGLRVGDLLHAERFKQKLAFNLEAWAPTIQAMGGKLPVADDIARQYLEYGKQLKPVIGDAATAVQDALRAGKRVLMEGAQGALLDVDSGTYPFVTSSSTVAGGACAGAGIGPTQIGQVIGIAKAYATRVGNGPFPTELDEVAGTALREAGSEFGATTGRPRRCGWLDLVALRYAVRINGLTGLALTKIDVLTGMNPIKVCVGYEYRGQRISVPPYDDLDAVRPIYEDLPGWKEDLSGCRALEDLPQATRNYLDHIERVVECPIRLVSVGADRTHTISIQHPFE